MPKKTPSHSRKNHHFKSMTNIFILFTRVHGSHTLFLQLLYSLQSKLQIASWNEMWSQKKGSTKLIFVRTFFQFFKILLNNCAKQKISNQMAKSKAFPHTQKLKIKKPFNKNKNKNKNFWVWPKSKSNQIEQG